MRNTPIGHNIAFLRNTLGIDFDNHEITPDIGLPNVYFTNEHVLLSNLKMLITVRNGDYTLSYLSSYEIERHCNYLTLFIIIIVCHMYIYTFIVYENKE